MLPWLQSHFHILEMWHDFCITHIIHLRFFRSMFCGNLLVFFLFQGKTHIDNDTRTLVFSILAGLAIIGIVFLGALRKPNQSNLALDDEIPDRQQGPKQAFINAARLFFTKRMLQLSVTFIYTGNCFIYLYRRVGKNISQFDSSWVLKTLPQN